MAEAENHALPKAANDSWRTWLITGSRRTPIDKRRLRGAHRGVKKMLIEGMTNGGDKPHAWKEFSGAMIRHAVDDAMRALPSQDKSMVKLAYFGGFSNREIAKEVGVTEATVQRRLRRAVDAISEYIEGGRSFGRRAFYALMLWLCGRWIGAAAHQVVQTAAVATASVIIVAQPAATPVKAVAPAAKQPVLLHSVDAPRSQTQVAPPRPTPAAPEPNLVSPNVQAPLVQVPSVQAPTLKLPVAPPSVPPRLPNVWPPA